MKITKFVHSCLLVESKEHTALIDPGVYSWQSGLLKFDDVKKIDQILITHEHPDHFHVPFIQAVLKKFPKAKVITNQAVVELLKSDNIAAETKAPDGLSVFETKH